MKFVATKKFLTNFFHPSLFYLFLDPGSEIWDPGSGMGKNQDPGSGIHPDPQHWTVPVLYYAERTKLVPVTVPVSTSMKSHLKKILILIFNLNFMTFWTLRNRKSIET